MFEERDKLAEGGAQACEAFRKDQERMDSFAADARQFAQSIGERATADQAMAEDAGRAVSSARFAFQQYGDDTPPKLNTIVTDEYSEFAFTIDTIRKSFQSFDDYLDDTGKGLGRFLDTVDGIAGDLISMGDGM